ncbi:MAG: hypothetical protein IT282_05995 [Bacteroidetes bacterium]|nr:hypothetical protein [Bacteroidota bacterium]
MTDQKDSKTTRRELRKFGITFCVILGAISAYLWYRQNGFWPWCAGAGMLFLAAGLLTPQLLRPIFSVWMKLAFVLAWINTRLILGVFFYLVLTPTGLLMRLFGKPLLDVSFDRAGITYWRKRDRAAFDRKRCERQF